MTFVLFSDAPLTERVGRIEVPSRTGEAQPYVGFATKEIADAFLLVKGLSTEVSLMPLLNAKGLLKLPFDILVFQSIQQVWDSMQDHEGYDHESLVRRYAGWEA